MKVCEVEGCKDKFLANGLCNKHYLRIKKHGSVNFRMKTGRHYKYATLKEALEDNIEPVTESGCWIWIKNAQHNRYGRITWRGKNEMAHRMSFKEYRYDIPENMLVCHKCDVPECINPNHLFVGTSLDNSRDMVNKQRQNQGTDCHTAKLTEQDVLNIKRLLSEGKTASEISRTYEMNSSTINDIKHGYIWKSMQNKIA